MGNGNIDVGNKTPTRKPGQPMASDPALPAADRPSSLLGKPSAPKICGAMSQQRGDCRGNQSAPQKFVQLVGCRDPKARPDPWVRPRAEPAKR